MPLLSTNATTGIRANAVVDALGDHLGWLLTTRLFPRHRSGPALRARNLAAFLAEARHLRVDGGSFSALESYQRNQYHHRKADRCFGSGPSSTAWWRSSCRSLGWCARTASASG